MMLKQLRLDVEESKLPLLPQGILPGGWDALGRPWAMMDCPTDQVPQIPSVHGHPRVTVAVLVSFPPESLYFPDQDHMDCALWVWKKAKQRRPVGMSEETQKDGSLKSAGTTYGRLTLPGYRHSMSVQEALKEAHWADFSEGRWGNRKNPRAPEGDVRPAPAQGTVPTEEQSAATASRSALSHRSVSRSVSVMTVSSQEMLTGGTLQIVIPTSGTDSSEEEIEVTVSPSRIPGQQSLPNNLLTEAVTTSVLHRQRAEDEAATSSSYGQRGKPSKRRSLVEKQDPRRTSCPAPEKSAGNDPVRAGTGRGQDAVTPVETHTWEEMEGAVWQGAHGTAEGTMGYALTVLDQMRTDVEERFRAQT